MARERTDTYFSDLLATTQEVEDTEFEKKEKTPTPEPEKPIPQPTERTSLKVSEQKNVDISQPDNKKTQSNTRCCSLM